MTRRIEVLHMPTKALKLLSEYINREVWDDLVLVALNASTGTDACIEREILAAHSPFMPHADPICLELVKKMHRFFKEAHPEIHRLSFSYRIVEVEINNRDVYIVMTKATTNSGASNG